MGRKSRVKGQRRSGYRTMKMHPEVKEGIERQIKRFREKFGRDPGPEDPIFFDPNADTPQFYSPGMADIKRQMVEAMMKANIDPAKIYAFQKTGMMLTRENYSQWSKQDLAEYDAAIKEFEARRTQ